jgi:hypothetical protein
MPLILLSFERLLLWRLFLSFTFRASLFLILLFHASVPLASVPLKNITLILLSFERLLLCLQGYRVRESHLGLPCLI